MRSKHLEISSLQIIYQRNKIGKELLKTTKDVSYGWFRGFKERSNLKRLNFHGEANMVNMETVCDWKV